MFFKTMLFKKENSRHESDELTEQLATLRRELVEKLWKNMVLIATIGVPISVSRALYTGWLLPYTVHVSAGLLVLVVAYQTQVSSWATLLIVTGAFSYFALSAFGTFNRSVVGLTARIKNQRDEIEVLAMYDELTGLPALRLTEDRVLRAIQSAKPYSHKMALMFIDLDGFKAVNDNLGHEAGDFVLREVAARLTREIRAEDTGGADWRG